MRWGGETEGMESGKTKLSILGLGTVGTGVVTLLEGNPEFEIRMISVRDRHKAREVDLSVFHLSRSFSERVGVPIGQCLFLDDHLGNVEGAISAGMPALHVTDVAAAAQDVRRRLDLG